MTSTCTKCRRGEPTVRFDGLNYHRVFGADGLPIKDALSVCRDAAYAKRIGAAE